VPQPTRRNDGILSIAELIQRARKMHSVPWHWDALDIDVLIRPRTHEENARGVNEVEVLQAVAGPDGSVDAHAYMRVELRACLPCVLHPDGSPMFTLDDVDEMMEMDSPSIFQLRDKVTEVSNWTKEKADEAGNDSGETDDDSNSTASPSPAETNTSSPIPMPSTP
jgi:hypothetical protein